MRAGSRPPQTMGVMTRPVAVEALKHCSLCGEWLPESMFGTAGPSSHQPDGLTVTDRVCTRLRKTEREARQCNRRLLQRVYQGHYASKHPEYYRAKRAEHYAAHQAEAIAAAKAWAEAHREADSAASRRYYARHAEEVKAKRRAAYWASRRAAHSSASQSHTSTASSTLERTSRGKGAR
jgi:hypothetical protein